MKYKLKTQFTLPNTTLISNKVICEKGVLFIYLPNLILKYIDKKWYINGYNMGYCYMPDFILEVIDESEILDKEQFDLMFEPFVENEENQLQNIKV